jgi:hypothetical protein
MMAAEPMPQMRRWLPWVHDAEFQRHLRDDVDVHNAAKKTADEILTGVDALNLSVTALSTKLGPLLPIASDLDQIVGRRRFRHEMYKLAGQTGRSVRKIIGWGGGTIVGLATLAAVYPPANDLLMWLLSKLTAGMITYRLPSIAATPPIPGVTH